MAQHERTAWLVIYDISSPRRLARVAKTLERRAIRLQYSVFLGVWSAGRLEETLGLVATQIHQRKDDVRAYRLPRRCSVEFLGRQTLDEEVVLAQRGFEILQLLGARGPEWLAGELGEEQGRGLISGAKS